MFSRVTVHTLTRRTYVRKYLSFQHENINLRILIFTQRSIAYLIPYVRIYKVIIVYIYIYIWNYSACSIEHRDIVEYDARGKEEILIHLRRMENAYYRLNRPPSRRMHTTRRIYRTIVKRVS